MAQSIWTIFCGTSSDSSLQENLNLQNSGVLSIFNPYSCVNHALIISINILFLFISVFILIHKSYRTNFIPRHESRSASSVLCISSVTFNCALGIVYLVSGLWTLGKELITKETVLPLHVWLVLLLQAAAWLLLSLTVSLKSRQNLCATSMKVYLIIAFLYAGFLCITSIWETVTDKVISVKTVLDILSFPGSILFFTFACSSSRSCVEVAEVDGAQGATLYSPLQGKDAEANDGKDENVTPFARASIFSKMTFWWLNPLMKQGKQETTLKDDDIPKLRPTDRAETCYSVFLDMLNKRKPKGSSQQRPSIMSTLFLWQRKPLIISGFFALTKVLATSTTPFILKAFIEVVEGEESFAYEAYALTACLFLVKCLESFSERQWYFSMRLIGLQIRSALSVAIYQKQLRLSPAADVAPGQLVSYTTVDSYRIGEFPYWFHQIWTTSLQMCLALLIIYYCVGMATVAAIIVVLLTVLGNMPLAKLQGKYQTGFMVEQDRMVQAVTEALGNMKILKLYAWETHFMKMVEQLRGDEFRWLKAVLTQKCYYIVLFWSSPLFVPIATFTACYFLGISLNASNVFTFLATIRLVQDPIRLIPDVVGAFIDAKVALDRIIKFLEAPELQESKGIQVGKGGDGQENGSIYVKASGISWETGASRRPTLRNINLEVKPGEKVAICGEIGAGKTSLLSAILGEVPYVNGSVQMNGKLAYVSQNAWIQTGTIQENILFGSAMYPQRYQDTLAKCCLIKDLDMLPYGDETVIGERGVNLSGGQKQRVQLARALYQDADVYLLDDPFSAVDAHTATSLFNEYVMGALAGKTVLLVTHQVDFLPAFDSILLMAGGEIIRAASYDELLASSEEFEGLVHAHDAAGTKQSSGYNHSTDKTAKPEIQNVNMDEQLTMNDQLVKTEERETGRNSLKPYIQYLKQDRGFLYLALANFFHTCFVLGQFAQNYLLATNIQSSSMSESLLITIYAAIGSSLVLVLIFRSWFIVLLGLGASRAMFSTLLRSLFRAPLSFYDSTPLGRILSRISSDLSIIDLDIAVKMNIAIGSTIITYFNLTVLTVLAWEVIFIVIPMIYLVVVLQRYYSAVAKELMRINGTTKSAVASHVAETAAGVMTIRAFGEETKFLCKGLDLIDKNASPFFHMFSANEWFIQRLEIIAVTVLSAAAFLMTVLPHSSSSAGLVGMALAYGLTLNTSMTTGFQSQCLLENMMISVERLEQYMHIPSEAPEVVEDNRPDPSWPDVGKVEICNLKVRYRPNAPLVLQGISCVIEGGYKVGIVGRTGSGKTTLVGTLFRLVEPTEGKIIVDGLDISTIGLHDLRSNFGIIPQEPTLFVGSVRYNFDPLSEHTDKEIWEVLEKCQLKEAVQEKPEGLSSLVVQDGSNWSMGQRQLFCLGRALLKRPNILVLDEATASIDNTTDAILQKTIRREFADHTVITVAHRIPTVMDSTKVLALADGRLVEYDDPEKLINQESSLFGQLVREYWSHTASGSGSND